MQLCNPTIIYVYIYSFILYVFIKYIWVTQYWISNSVELLPIMLIGGFVCLFETMQVKKLLPFLMEDFPLT